MFKFVSPRLQIVEIIHQRPSIIKVSFSTPLKIFRALSDKLAFESAGRIEKMVLSVNYIEAPY